MLPVALIFALLTPSARAAQAGASFEEAEAKRMLRAGNYAEAVLAYRKLVLPGSDRVDLWSDYAQALTLLGRREEGLQVLLAASTRGSEAQRRTLLRRARVLSRVFIRKEAQQLYLDSETFLQSRKFAAARERLEKAASLESGHVLLLVRLGQTWLMEQDADSAAERFRQAKRLAPWEPEVDLWLGRALHQRGEAREALEALQRARSALPPGDAALWDLASAWQAEALVSLTQRAEAGTLLEAEVKRSPLSLYSLLALARLRSGASRDLKAQIQARKALQLFLSRLGELKVPSPSSGDLFLAPSTQQELLAQAKELLERVDLQLAGANRNTPVSADRGY